MPHRRQGEICQRALQRRARREKEREREIEGTDRCRRRVEHWGSGEKSLTFSSGLSECRQLFCALAALQAAAASSCSLFDDDITPSLGNFFFTSFLFPHNYPCERVLPQQICLSPSITRSIQQRVARSPPNSNLSSQRFGAGHTRTHRGSRASHSRRLITGVAWISQAGASRGVSRSNNSARTVILGSSPLRAVSCSQI